MKAEGLGWNYEAQKRASFYGREDRYLRTPGRGGGACSPQAMFKPIFGAFNLLWVCAQWMKVDARFIRAEDRAKNRTQTQTDLQNSARSGGTWQTLLSPCVKVLVCGTASLDT